MAILIMAAPARMKAWREAIGANFPGEDIRCWPGMGEPADIDIVVYGGNEPELFGKLANLKLVISQRAGIDDLIGNPHLSQDVAICRAQDPKGDRMLDDYALLLTLYHHRHMPDLLAANARAEWIDPGVLPADERSVGVMGLGIIGMSVARRLRDAGFRVAGWSRTRRDEPGMECFHGPDQFDTFLARSEILLNLLALTPETVDIVDAANLARLPKGASVINLGRGEHVVDSDLITAVDSGHIDSATLDVFRTEPLPADHPFWKHPRIFVMPHTARRPRAESLTPGILEIIRRFRAGEPLPRMADRARGY
jgi:glyoxylate/hydroxypyruvate reductase A